MTVLRLRLITECALFMAAFDGMHYTFLHPLGPRKRRTGASTDKNTIANHQEYTAHAHLIKAPLLLSAVVYSRLKTLPSLEGYGLVDQKDTLPAVPNGLIHRVVIISALGVNTIQTLHRSSHMQPYSRLGIGRKISWGA